MRNRFLVKLLILGLGITFFGGAFAQSDVLVGTATLLGLLVNIFTFLALKLIELGGQLMGTEWITGVDAMNGIRPMWILIRNIVNITFVVVLVVLSFTNLFAGMVGSEGGWSIKEKLPKALIALVAINFSLLGFQIVLDGVNVASVAVMSLADDSLEKVGTASVQELLNYATDEDGDRCYTEINVTDSGCKTFAFTLNEAFCKDGPGSDGCWFQVDDKDEMTTASSSAQNLILAFGVHFQHLQRLPLISAQIGSWSEVVQDTLFSVIMGLAYLVALIAVFVALLARVISCGWSWLPARCWSPA